MKYLLLVPILLFSTAAFANDRACSVIIFDENMTPTAAENEAFSDADVSITLDTKDGFISEVKHVVIDAKTYVRISITKGKVSSSSVFSDDADHPFHTLTIEGISAQAQCPIN